MRDFRSKMEQITYFSSKRANNKEKCAKLKNKTIKNNCAQKYISGIGVWDTLSRTLVLQQLSTSYSLHYVIQGVVTLGKHNKTNYGFILSACYFLFISFQLFH